MVTLCCIYNIVFYGISASTEVGTEMFIFTTFEQRLCYFSPLLIMIVVVSHLSIHIAMSTQTSNLGITFTESHPAQETDWHGHGLSLMGTERLGNESVADHTWTISDTANRPTLVATKVWAQSEAVGHVINTYKIPWDLLTSSVMQSGFQKFEFFNGDINIKITPNSNRFNQGLLMVNFIPMMAVSDELSFMHSASRYYNMRALFIDAAVNNEVNLKIPYMHIKDFLPLGINDPEIDFLGTLIITVLSPLVATDTSASVGLNIMAWFDSPVFRIPAAEQHVIPTLPLKSQLARNPKHLARLLDSISEELQAIPQMDIVGALVGGAIPSIVNKLLPPTNPQPDLDSPNTFTGAPSSTLGSIAASKYVTNHERFALDPSNVAKPSPSDFDSNASEMDFSHLLSIPSLMDVVDWKTSDAAGTIIWTSYIGPFSKMEKMTNGSAYSVSALDYFSAPFAFWSGGIKYNLKLITNMIATGRLALEIHYGSYTTDATLASGTGQYVNYIDAANAERQFHTDVSYIASTQRRRVGHGTHLYNKPHDYYIGVLALRVINPLSSPSNLSQTAQIFIDVSAADNYRLYYPSASNSSTLPTSLMSYHESPYPDFLPISSTMSEVPTPQMDRDQGITTADAPDELPPHEAVVPDNPIAPQPNTSPPSEGEMIMATGDSFREIIKKWSPIYSGSARKCDDAIDNSMAYVTSFVTFPVTPITTFQNTGEVTDPYGYDIPISNGPLGYFTTPFRAWKGDLRYKVVLRNPPPTYSGVDSLSGSYNNTFLLYAGFTPHTLPAGSSSLQLGPMITESLGLARRSTTSTHYLSDGYVRPANTATIVEVDSSEYRSRGAFQFIAVADQDKSYLEFEIPWQSIYRKLMVLQPNDGPVDLSFYATGSVWFAVSTPFGNIDVTSANTDAFTTLNYWQPTFSIFQAAGDNFEVGWYIGVPQLYVRETMWPDGYIAPADTRLQRLAAKVAALRLQVRDKKDFARVNRLRTLSDYLHLPACAPADGKLSDLLDESILILKSLHVPASTYQYLS